MKTILAVLALTSTLAQAETPWARDCVNWYGGSIPQSERTVDNCPRGHSHWDREQPSGSGYIDPSANSKSLVTSQAAGSMPYSVILPTGVYVVVPNGAGRIPNIIQTSKTK
jgi:hypothetical protein